MEKPDFEQCGQEANEMQGLPPTSVEVSQLGVFAIITLVQAAVQQIPEIADDGWAKIGIAAARQLQKDLFNQDSETYKVLEFGWNPGADLVTSDIAAMLWHIKSRQLKKNKFFELDLNSDETISQQVSRKILESQGYLDM
jgi:hypothetical protein